MPEAGRVNIVIVLMRVLFFINGLPDRRNCNNGIYNLRAARGLKNMVDLQLVIPRAWLPNRRPVSCSTVEGLPVITIAAPQLPGCKRLNVLSASLVAGLVLGKHFRQADLVHTVGVDYAGVVSGRLARRCRVRHVTQFISNIDCLRLNFRRYPFFDALAGHLHGIVCNSRALQDTARSLFPNVTHVRTVFRGVDFCQFTPDGPGMGPFRECPPVRFLFLGGVQACRDRLHGSNTKGGETLMAAWKRAECDSRFANPRLLFAGPNARNHQSVSWRASLQRPGNVELMDGIPPEDVPAYVRASDVVLIPSMEEGLPNLAMEASACARPVFGSDIGGISDVVVPEETGLLIMPGNVDAWKRVLVDFSNANGISRLKDMGGKGRKRMESHFDHREYPRQLVNLYEDVLKAPLQP